MNEIGSPACLLDGVLIAYRHQGFEAGHAIARHEARSAILLATADFIRDHAQGDLAVRQLLCEFQAYLDQRLAAAATHDFVENGLGI